MIKVILWDIDGTLLDFEAAERVAIRHCFKEFALGECTDSMLADYSQINRKYWERLERGEMTKPEILVGRFSEFFARYGLDTGKATTFNEMYQVSLGDTAVFCKNGLETVQKLQGRLLQCAVTNGTKVAQDKKLKNSGLINLLQHVFISEDIGMEKPNTAFFDRVFSTVGDYSRDEILIVGDSLTSDMQGGVNAGIKTCWYNPLNKPNTSANQLDYVISDLAQVLDIIG